MRERAEFAGCGDVSVALPSELDKAPIALDDGNGVAAIEQQRIVRAEPAIAERRQIGRRTETVQVNGVSKFASRPTSDIPNAL